MGLVSGIKKAISAHMKEKVAAAKRARKKRMKLEALRKQGHKTPIGTKK
jgi:hypothetical protein